MRRSRQIIQGSDRLGLKGGQRRDPSGEHDPKAGSCIGSVRVRPATSADTPQLRQIYLESRRAAFSWLPADGFTLADFDDDTDCERIWLATANGEILGFGSVWTQTNFLHHLFVLPQWCSRGVGTLLLTTLCRQSPAHMTLKCLKRNRRAVVFYDRLQWSIVDEGRGDDGEYYLMCRVSANADVHG